MASPLLLPLDCDGREVTYEAIEQAHTRAGVARLVPGHAGDVHPGRWAEDWFWG